MLNCPRCQGTVGPTALVCPHCGALFASLKRRGAGDTGGAPLVRLVVVVIVLLLVTGAGLRLARRAAQPPAPRPPAAAR